MAKPLDPKAIEAERQTSSRAERREQKRRQMQDEISYNQRGNGVIIIPPQKRRELAEEPPKLRVAAYCRVSTQEEQQVGSFDMQIHHFTKRIEANPQWELVEIYQDEGISATTVEKRLGFQKMIADAVDGKIDLILTKSISRFGRNIVDILDNLRTLSALNPPVSVEFETEGITYTGDGRNNLLISLLAALAEMESQQKSEAIKAGIRWRMAEGIYKFSVQNAHAEFSALQSSSAELRTQLETLQPDISALKNIRKYIDMVLNKQQLSAPGGKMPEKESVLKQLEQLQQKKSNYKTISTTPNREESL